MMGAGSVRNSPIGGVMMGDEGLRETFQKLDHRPVIWVPGGFGDTHWIMLKMESMIERWFAGKKPIVHVIGEPDPRHNRSGDYISRLPFVDFGGYVPGGVPVLLAAFHAQILAHGHGFDLSVYASRHIEAGLRIEKWMPSLEVNWNYEITETEEDREFGEQFLERHGPFALVTFFNTGYYVDATEDMTDERIVGLMHKLAEELHPRKLILTGGWWDREYHDRLATMGAPAVVTSGTTTGAQMLALLRRADAFVGHQAGNTMLAHHFNTPTVLFWSKRWRNSARVRRIEDGMWTAWACPERIGVTYDAIEMTESDDRIIESIRRSVANDRRKRGEHRVARRPSLGA